MNSTDLRSRPVAADARCEPIASSLQSPPLLGLRVFIGWQFFGAGARRGGRGR